MRLEIRCENRLGITQDVLEILVRHQIDLQGIEVHPQKIFVHFPNIEFAEFQHLMPEIRRVDGVFDVVKVDYMPLEIQSAEYDRQLDTSCEKWLSVDTNGALIRMSVSAKGYFTRIVKQELADVSTWIKGFNLNRWLDKQPSEGLLAVAEVAEQTFQLELQPLWLNNYKGSREFSGAVVRFIESHSQYPNEHKAHAINNSIVQNSAVMRKVVRECKKLAVTTQSVLLIGEMGTGKQLIVELMHALGPFNTRPLTVIDLNNSNVFQQLDKVNLQLCGGLYLKHLDSLQPDKQAELLQWLTDHLDDLPQVKLYASTKYSLNSAVQLGTFSEPLLYRLAGCKLMVPSLRQRPEDIAELTQLFVQNICAELGTAPIDISQDAIKFLQAYSWPANANQLYNALYQAVVLSGRQPLLVSHIRVDDDKQQDDDLLSVQDYLDNGLDEAVKQFESTLLRKLYPYYPSTRQLANKLGLSHTAIANKLREYGINKTTVKVARRS
ncbi:transcriptional regulatory protein tyrR [Catenovulum agarivorans DS-2]|uniref:Transcriptional regulatory protein tyrR n=1 Tax=Catenovulum agarivorans DS-2 TaxID=1328313 RepID=W7QUI6_9ALTE|nr:TyrR/PhhR family helix-turn-helix DNA-binding protein [Catenovulum agarivorans]EWH09070.1 transcriptional regulatory protein tyrR [Catenovulum agarivorans DS-2]